jgi:hypothetical protein
MAVEARMLGLRVIANTLVSAIHEDWFRKYKGLDLINYFREKNKSIPQFINRCFKKEDEKKVIQNSDITCILTLYRRGHLLQEQINALLNQSIPPKQIWVWKNYHEDNKNFDKSKIKGVDRWIESDYNFSYFGRFSLATMVETEYTHILDDDTINGKLWHENALNVLIQENGLVGGVGVVLSDETYSSPHQRYGWPNFAHLKIEKVDLAGHSWFFKSEWIKYFWQEKPYTFETCEDLHFSAMLEKNGISTIIPVQNTKDNTSSQKGYEYGTGIEASSHPNEHNKFYKLRDECVKYYIKNGFKLRKNI